MFAQFETSGITASQVVMLLVAVAGLTIVMLSTRRRIRESRSLSRPSVRERYASTREQQASRRDLENVMLELDQLSRQIHGRIDTKLARLEALLREADARIDTLSRLSVSSGDLRPTPKNQAQPEPITPTSSPTESTDATRASVHRLAEAGRSPVEIARVVGRTPGEVELMIALQESTNR